MCDGMPGDDMPKQKKEIELEPFVNEAGFLLLRDRESKRPIKFQSGVKIDILNRDRDDFQMATITVPVDPRIYKA